MRRWKVALNPQTPEANAAFDEMLNHLDNAETDAVYWKLKYQRKWPGDEDALSESAAPTP